MGLGGFAGVVLWFEWFGLACYVILVGLVVCLLIPCGLLLFVMVLAWIAVRGFGLAFWLWLCGTVGMRLWLIWLFLFGLACADFCCLRVWCVIYGLLIVFWVVVWFG